MELTDELCYQALLTHDARFDGAFFVGVSSTGIYCRTVCTARTPRRENCTFFRSPAAAERRGFRPCLRCRPELAPGKAPLDASDRLAAAAASRIEDGALVEGGVEDLAADLGVTARHLRRIVEREFGVTPIELAQTSRLLLAKRLLTATALPVGDIAFASGFSSLRRFNALFKERYRLNPTDLRRDTRRGRARETLSCELGYHPPFDWDAMLRFLRGHLCAGAESVVGETYMRTHAVGNCSGWFSVAHDARGQLLRVEISMSLAPVLRRTLADIKRAFDLHAQPVQIAARLGELAIARPGLRVPGTMGGFELAARAVLGQQVSVAAATTIAARWIRTFGAPIETPHPGLTHLAPTPAQIARLEPEQLAAIGIIATRARSIVLLAREIDAGRLTLEPGTDPETAMSLLRALPGIGEWTAQYIAMRALAWPDAFPHTDLAVRKAMSETDSKRILERAEAWRPWRAYATMHLWKSLEITP